MSIQFVENVRKVKKVVTKWAWVKQVKDEEDLKLLEEDHTVLIYYLTEFGLIWRILPSGPNY